MVWLSLDDPDEILLVQWEPDPAGELDETFELVAKQFMQPNSLLLRDGRTILVEDPSCRLVGSNRIALKHGAEQVTFIPTYQLHGVGIKPIS